MAQNLYNDISQHYDSVSTQYDSEANRNFYAFFARSLTDEIKQTNMKFNNVLEIGCGSGFSTLELLQLVESSKVKAVDISKNMIDKATAKKELQRIKFYSNLKGVKDEKFDLIFSSFSYHWWNDNMVKMLLGMINENSMIALCVPARKPDLLLGNLLILNAIKKIKAKKSNSNDRTIGLTQKKLFDDLSLFSSSKVQIKTVKLIEKFINLKEFINALEVRGSLLALSKYYDIDVEAIKRELYKHLPHINNPIEISWKAHVVIVFLNNGAN